MDRVVTRQELTRLGVPSALHLVQFKDVIGNLPAKAMIKRYVNNFEKLPFGTGLVIYGPALSGKSMLAAVVAKSLLARNIELFWTNLNKITKALFQFNGDAGNPVSEPVDFEHFSEVPLLVIDGLSAVEISDQKQYVMNDGMRSAFCQVLHNRVIQDKPTIITSRFPLRSSNPEQASLFSLFGEAVYHILKSRYVNVTTTENPQVLAAQRKRIDEILMGGDD